MRDDLIVLRPEGLYCTAGRFHIDPWRPVERAVITHAHADHARAGHKHYLAAEAGEKVLRTRLGEIALQTVRWGERLKLGDVHVSLHPAGHILGSAQVRVERGGEVWVVSGDYKLESDPTCAAFDPVRCDTFITESTFGLPIYRWQPDAQCMAEIARWWQSNASQGRASVLLCYALGKAQRVLAGLAGAQALIGPIVCHGATETVNAAYRASGVALPPTRHASDWRRETVKPLRTSTARSKARAAELFGQADATSDVVQGWSSDPAPLVLAPPSAAGTPWLARFGDASLAFASGWMRIRGARRRRAVDRGFVLSDHADWPGLLSAISATGACRVIVTHGFEAAIVRQLSLKGLHAQALRTEFGGEAGAESEPIPAP